MGAKAIFFRASRIPTRPPLLPGIFEKTCFKLNNDHILFIQNLNPTNHFRFTFACFTQSIIPHMICFWGEFVLQPLSSSWSFLHRSGWIQSITLLTTEGFIQRVPNCNSGMTRCPLRSPWSADGPMLLQGTGNAARSGISYTMPRKRHFVFQRKIHFSWNADIRWKHRENPTI